MTKLVDITGKAISGEWGTDDTDGNGTPVLRTTNFTNDGVISYSNVVTRKIQKRNINDKFLRQGDIIIEKSGGSDKQPVGRVVFFDGEENKYLFNNFTGLLRVKDKDSWLPRYVFYVLYANYLYGGTRPYENRTTGLHNLQTDSYVMATTVKDVAIEKQAEIVGILDRVQSLISKRRQQLASLDLLVKARFVEMFGDPVSNPMGWKKMSMRDTCKVITGNTPARSVAEYYGDFVEWIKTDNIVSGVIYPTEATERLSKRGMDEGRIVDKDAILMACIAGSVASIGRVCITNRTVAFNQQINAIIPNVYNVLFLYIMLQISKEYLIKDINMALKGILSKSKLEEKEFILPPLSLQNQFADFVTRVDKAKLAAQKSLQELETLKKSLMQQYFG